MGNSGINNSLAQEYLRYWNILGITDLLLPRPKWVRLERLRAIVENCKKCDLSKSRRNIVFGEGNPDAKLMIVGEAPGAREDATGMPFVGASGKKLTSILKENSIERDKIYIANVVKCRPPGNRTPMEKEILSCGRYLNLQVDIIQPKYILTLGNVPTGFFLNVSGGITRLRGRIFNYKGIRIFPTFHPSYLLKNPDKEKIFREDISHLRELIPDG